MAPEHTDTRQANLAEVWEPAREPTAAGPGSHDLDEDAHVLPGQVSVADSDEPSQTAVACLGVKRSAQCSIPRSFPRPSRVHLRSKPSTLVLSHAATSHFGPSWP